MKYTTDFSGFAPESPISEGGKWTNTVSATWTAPVTTVAGPPARAVAPAASGSNDAVAMLTGVWGPNQTVTVVCYGNAGGGFADEIEPHLRMTMIPGTPDQIFSYEIDCTAGGMNIVRWDGPQGTFTLLASPSTANLVDGDVVEASISGSPGAISISVKINGTPITGSPFSDTDAVKGLATGSPGMGFDNGPSAVFGIKNYTATDGLVGAGPVGRFIEPVLLW